MPDVSIKRTTYKSILPMAGVFPPLLAIFIALHLAASDAWAEAGKAGVNDNRTVFYSFTLSNATDRVLENLDFATYAPFGLASISGLNSWLKASLPYKLEVDELGNRIMHFRLDRMPPYANRVIQIRVQVYNGERLKPVPLMAPETFLGKDRYVEADATEVRQISQEVNGESPLNTARNIYSWIKRNIRNSGYTRQELGALHALHNRRGDCTEQMYLFVALARACGIPARGMGGYIVENDGILKANSYHNWAEFYVDRIWHIADPHQGNFMENQSNYIAMCILSGKTAAGRKNFSRFWSSSEGLKVKMR